MGWPPWACPGGEDFHPDWASPPSPRAATLSGRRPHPCVYSRNSSEVAACLRSCVPGALSWAQLDESCPCPAGLRPPSSPVLAQEGLRASVYGCCGVALGLSHPLPAPPLLRRAAPTLGGSKPQTFSGSRPHGVALLLCSWGDSLTRLGAGWPQALPPTCPVLPPAAGTRCPGPREGQTGTPSPRDLPRPWLAPGLLVPEPVQLLWSQRGRTARCGGLGG